MNLRTKQTTTYKSILTFFTEKSEKVDTVNDYKLRKRGCKFRKRQTRIAKIEAEIVELEEEIPDELKDLKFAIISKLLRLPMINGTSKNEKMNSFLEWKELNL